jgi:hypothetical protein
MQRLMEKNANSSTTTELLAAAQQTVRQRLENMKLELAAIAK